MRSILAPTPFVRATVTNFFFFLGLNGFVLLPLYILALGGTEIEIGLVMGLYTGVGIVCQPLLGPIVDAVGRRPFMLVGTGLVLGATLLASTADTMKRTRKPQKRMIHSPMSGATAVDTKPDAP